MSKDRNIDRFLLFLRFFVGGISLSNFDWVIPTAGGTPGPPCPCLQAPTLWIICGQVAGAYWAPFFEKGGSEQASSHWYAAALQDAGEAQG